MYSWQNKVLSQKKVTVTEKKTFLWQKQIFVTDRMFMTQKQVKIRQNLLSEIFSWHRNKLLSNKHFGKKGKDTEPSFYQTKISVRNKKKSSWKKFSPQKQVSVRETYSSHRKNIFLSQNKFLSQIKGFDTKYLLTTHNFF